MKSTTYSYISTGIASKSVDETFYCLARALQTSPIISSSWRKDHLAFTIKARFTCQ